MTEIQFSLKRYHYYEYNIFAVNTFTQIAFDSRISTFASQGHLCLEGRTPGR